jgi:hypothetical protein
MQKEPTYYRDWKDHRRQVPVPEDFAAGVMARIEARKPQSEFEAPEVFAACSSRVIQWSLAAGLAALGLFRLLYVVVNLLQANLLMPY